MDRPIGIQRTDWLEKYLLPILVFALVIASWVGPRARGWATARASWLDQGVAALEHAHALDAHHREVQSLLSRAYRLQGQEEKAVRLLQTTAQSYPHLAWPHLLLGEWYESQGDERAAIAAYERAVRADPADAEPYLALARLYESRGAPAGWLAELYEDEVLAGLVAYDLYEGLEHEAHVSDRNFVRRTLFVIDTWPQQVLFQHPISRIEYALQVPPDARLAFSMALAPEVWRADWGDGVQFEVYLAGMDGEWALWSEYIDPKNDPADRRWHDRELDLGPWAGQAVTLTLVTTPGPAADDRYDWAGWGTPRIVQRAGQESAERP